MVHKKQFMTFKEFKNTRKLTLSSNQIKINPLQSKGVSSIQHEAMSPYKKTNK